MFVASTTLPSLSKVRFFISILLLIFTTSVGATFHHLLPHRLFRYTFRFFVLCTVNPSSQRFASRHISIPSLTPLCFHVLFTLLFTFTFHCYCSGPLIWTGPLSWMVMHCHSPNLEPSLPLIEPQHGINMVRVTLSVTCSHFTNFATHQDFKGKKHGAC